MKNSLRIPSASVLLRASLALTAVTVFAAGTLRAADTSYWIEPCANPQETSCVPSDVQLAKWALEAWQSASGGKLHFVETRDRETAQIRLVWATRSEGLYGETVPFRGVNGRRGAQIYVRIAPPPGDDRLLRDTIVYLTCLHESGHALGLAHTKQFEDIMYSFQYGGDIPEYFGRYRRKLNTQDDIRRNSGMSPADRDHLAQALTVF